MVEAPQLTHNQSLVFDVLCEERSPLSAYSILDHLREKGMKAPLQVYRALDRLMEIGIVHRLESINAFVACSQTDDAHACSHEGSVAAFAICQDCGDVTEFVSGSVQHQLGDWARQHAFIPVKSTIEISGHCSQCAGDSK